MDASTEEQRNHLWGFQKLVRTMRDTVLEYRAKLVNHNRTGKSSLEQFLEATGQSTFYSLPDGPDPLADTPAPGPPPPSAPRAFPGDAPAQPKSGTRIDTLPLTSPEPPPPVPDDAPVQFAADARIDTRLPNRHHQCQTMHPFNSPPTPG